jgi:flavin reductase (DIM6/NTAB) family NADH-FMN oxidoreductase RutF
MFIAEVVAVHADDKYMDAKTGAFDLSLAEPLCYAHGQYYKLGKPLGKFGWSVEKKKTKDKRKLSSKK